MTTEELDKLAEEIYDYCNANRRDNLNKNGSPGDPRKVSSPYSTVYDEVKTFYRNVVKWHLSKSS
jgi:transposase